MVEENWVPAELCMLNRDKSETAVGLIRRGCPLGIAAALRALPVVYLHVNLGQRRGRGPGR